VRSRDARGGSENFHVPRNEIAKFHHGHALTTFARIRFARIGFEGTAEKIDDSAGRRGGEGRGGGASERPSYFNSSSTYASGQ